MEVQGEVTAVTEVVVEEEDILKDLISAIMVCIFSVFHQLCINYTNVLVEFYYKLHNTYLSYTFCSAE